MKVSCFNQRCSLHERIRLFFQQLFQHETERGIILERLRKSSIRRDPILYKVIKRIRRLVRNVHEEFFDGFVQDSIASIRGGGLRSRKARLIVVGKGFVRGYRGLHGLLVTLVRKVTRVAIV